MTKQIEKIYLDYAAATPVADDVLEAMMPYFQRDFFNPSAIYLDSRGVRKTIDQARHSVAQQLGSKPDEVIFTAGATESCNLAINGIMSQYPDGNIVTSNIEHEAVLQTASKYDHAEVLVDQQGTVSREALKEVINDKTVLVSIIYANNEIGTIQNLSDPASLISDIRDDRKKRGIDFPIFLHSDGAQAGNYLDVHVSRLGVDLFTLNGGKIYGPKQSGILYVRSGTVLEPQILGGGQEFGLRSGTENVANVVGFSAALTSAQSSRKDESHRLMWMRDDLMRELQANIDDVMINGSQKSRLPNNVNFSIDGIDGERLVMMLDEQGVQCATGAACSALSDESSHVIKALGRSESEAKGSLRISMGRFTTQEHIKEFSEALKDALSEMRK